MKICGAQTKPVTGNIQVNIERHLPFIDRAVSCHANAIIFSELSLTGYEPSLAKELSTRPDDQRFDVFQRISNTCKVSIGVGVPTHNGNHVSISMILFSQTRRRSSIPKNTYIQMKTNFLSRVLTFPVS